MIPCFQDDNQYAVLTNEGTIPGEFGGYSSVYVDHFEDWLSDVTLQNVWISTEDNYDYHRKTDTLFRKILGKILITTNLADGFWEIKMNITKDEFKYSNICNNLSKLAQAKDLFRDDRINGVTFIFFSDKSMVLNIEATQGNIIKYFSDNNPQNLEKYCKIALFSIDPQPDVFWETKENYISGKAAIEKLAELIEIKAEVKDENYINGPEFQRFIYKGAVKEKGQLLHLVELEQKLPLLGDYIHYHTLAELKVNALTGEAIINEPLLGESRVTRVEKDIKECIITTVKDKLFKSNKVELGKIEADKSLFIGLKDEADTKVVKVQLFTDEGGYYYVILTLKKQETGWTIIDEQLPDVKSEGVGD